MSEMIERTRMLVGYKNIFVMCKLFGAREQKYFFIRGKKYFERVTCARSEKIFCAEMFSVRLVTRKLFRSANEGELVIIFATCCKNYPMASYVSKKYFE